MTEYERIYNMLQTYFEMTQEPDDEGKVADNPEWDRGFQAAMALIGNNKPNQPDQNQKLPSHYLPRDIADKTLQIWQLEAILDELKYRQITGGNVALFLDLIERESK
jgi:hypothetical protein